MPILFHSELTGVSSPALDAKGPLEVGFTFHRYGFPMLPGSSVKGIATGVCAGSMKRSDRRSDPDFLSIFGRAPQDREYDESVARTGGGSCFLRRYSCPTAQAGIGHHEPALSQTTMDKVKELRPPIGKIQSRSTFLTVAPNTEFRFAVGWRGVLNDETRRLRDLGKDWLIKGLTELGAGAKTSAGYGYFVE